MAPDDHEARVQAHAEHQPHLLARVERDRLGVHRAADVEGGEHGATGVILVGERRAEQRHEAVAEELVHRAFVAMHLRERRLEEAAQERVHAVGADPLGEGGGADEVAEEHGDGLALALHGGARGEDLLGEMPGRVGLRRGARGRRGGRLDPGAAAGQKRAPSGSAAPHAAQCAPSRVPHATQNRALAGLSCWQRGQVGPERTLMEGLWHSSRGPHAASGRPPDPAHRRPHRRDPRRDENDAASRGLGGRPAHHLQVTGTDLALRAAYACDSNRRGHALVRSHRRRRAGAVPAQLGELQRPVAPPGRRAGIALPRARRGSSRSRRHLRVALYAPDAPGRRGRAAAAAARRAALADPLDRPLVRRRRRGQDRAGDPRAHPEPGAGRAGAAGAPPDAGRAWRLRRGQSDRAGLREPCAGGTPGGGGPELRGLLVRRRRMGASGRPRTGPRRARDPVGGTPVGGDLRRIPRRSPTTPACGCPPCCCPAITDPSPPAA